MFLSQLKVNNENINFSGAIKYLGVYLDSQLNLKQHIGYKCRMAMFNIHRIRNTRYSLTTEATHTLVFGLVISHLDFCNSILFGLPQSSIKNYRELKTQQPNSFSIRVNLIVLQRLERLSTGFQLLPGYNSK